MLYAAAVSFGADVSPWAASAAGRATGHPAPAAGTARRRSALPGSPPVGPRGHRTDGETLARLALLDPAPSVRVEAAKAIAEMSTEGNAPAAAAAVNHLAGAWHEPATRAPASRALTTIHDRAPDSLDGLDTPIRRTVGGPVRVLRWRRNRQRILADTLQGLQWSIMGTGLDSDSCGASAPSRTPRCLARYRQAYDPDDVLIAGTSGLCRQEAGRSRGSRVAAWPNFHVHSGPGAQRVGERRVLLAGFRRDPFGQSPHAKAGDLVAASH